MVAYNFKAMFAPAIVAGTKRQTIRADRKRHVQPGEALQLYVAMRTKKCRKIIEPDPICVSVEPIMIVMDEQEILAICIDGIYLHAFSIRDFARTDGFLSPRDMHTFWMENHGARNFNGVLIKWAPATKENVHV